MKLVLSRVAAVALLAAAALYALAGTASAHSFLANTDPAQGARLEAPPEDLALQFSEAIVRDSVVLTLRRASGEELTTPPPALESGGAVVRQPLSRLDAGVYVVAWHVTSAVDGHESAGEFAFAVGGASGADLDAEGGNATDVDAPAAAVTWLFFAGLAVAAGGLAGPVLLRPAAGEPVGRRTWVRAGATVAVVGVAARMWLEGVPAAAPTVAGLAPGAAAMLLLLVLLTAPLAAPLPAGLLAGAVVAWSARSHSAAAEGPVGWLLDAVHLATAAVWAGALMYVVAALWRRRHEDRRQLFAGVGRYARAAALLVAVVAGTGVVQATLLLPEPSALWTTGYGLVISTKTALFVAALVAAAIARGRALPRGRPRLLRGLTTTESSVLAGVLAAAAVLVNATPPQPADAGESLLGPPPVEGPVVHAMGLAGTLTVHVEAGGDRLDVGVLSAAGGIDGAQVEVTARYPDGTSSELHPRPCGAGCFTQELSLPDGRTELAVTASAPGRAGGTVTHRLVWPPEPERPELFDRMVAAMRAVSSVSVAESVYSGPDGPDPGPPEGPGVAMSGEQLVSLMPWAGGGVVDVRPLPDDKSGFGFFLPGSTMYFEVRVDERGRLVEQHLVNPGHEIDYRFTYPDGPA